MKHKDYYKKQQNWNYVENLYGKIHSWVGKRKPKPKNCEICGLPEFYNNKLGKLELSNKTGKLIKDVDNFQYVHASCHRKYDRENKIIHEGINYL